MNHFQKRASDIEVLFVGSSHFEKGINPGLMKRNSFNIAYSAQDLYYSTALSLKAFPKIDRIKWLVFEVSWFSIGYDESSSNNPLIKDYSRDLSIPPRHQSITDFTKL